MTATRLNMRFPDGKVRVLTLSYDDQSEQDIRLIDIMNENGIRGTFNISTGLYSPEGKTFKEGSVCRRMTRERAIELYKDSHHEVAVHGYSHPYLTQMPDASVTKNIAVDKALIV